MVKYLQRCVLVRAFVVNLLFLYECRMETRASLRNDDIFSGYLKGVTAMSEYKYCYESGYAC